MSTIGNSRSTDAVDEIDAQGPRVDTLSDLGNAGGQRLRRAPRYRCREDSVDEVVR